MGSQWYVKLVKITAVAANGDKFEYKEPVLQWTAIEAAPGPETMTEEEVKQLVAELTDSIAAKKIEIDGMEEGTTAYDDAVAELDEMEADLAEACEYTTCVEKNAGNSDGAVSESGLDLTVVLIVIGVIIAALLAGLMFMRGGNGGNSPEKMVDWANELPANDAVANSMYGGAQEIFQQPVALLHQQSLKFQQEHLHYLQAAYQRMDYGAVGVLRPPISAMIGFYRSNLGAMVLAKRLKWTV